MGCGTQPMASSQQNLQASGHQDPQAMANSQQNLQASWQQDPQAMTSSQQNLQASSQQMDPECVFSSNREMADCEEDFSGTLKTFSNLLEKQIKVWWDVFTFEHYQKENLIFRSLRWEVSPQDGLNDQKYVDEWREFFNKAGRDLQSLVLSRKQIKLGLINEKIRIIQEKLEPIKDSNQIKEFNSNIKKKLEKIDRETQKKKVPVSRCSRPCLPGNRKKFGTSIHKCCYECIPCPEGEISNISDCENCMKCPDDVWPNEKKDRCVLKLVEFLSYTDDTISAVFSSISILFCLLACLILGMFVHYQDTPIVKANNRNLSYLLLVSIMLSFLCVFLFLGHPVDVTCMLRVTSFGVIFSVAVSSLLAKSIMVCVAFKATKPGSSWKKWMGARLPNSIMSVCPLVQVIICATWLSISPPFQDQDFYSYLGKIIIQCNEGSVIGFYSVLGYMGLLAAVSFIIAFLARTLPDSFNEAKYITFSMLVFCSVWIAMIPAYLSTKGKYMVAVEIFAIMASSAGLLVCIFLPKCYIILFRPDLNTKTGLLGNRTK
ncbi:vomeronasal type-2 receptor 26-like [Aquarana catesbeiana]|uniref:vomeronasal type-2 receptor 26-like n=1 Tax=Aquarana catesbeiana TaxID=8400 RepID=UPI003CC9EA58